MDSARLSAAKSSPMMETINMVSASYNENICWLTLEGSVQSLQVPVH